MFLHKGNSHGKIGQYRYKLLRRRPQAFLIMRGTSEIIRSDNASNAKGAQGELRDAIKLWNKGKHDAERNQVDI